jgi:GxxExxY protein
VNEERVATQLVDASVAIHRALGSGLLESAYIAAMEIECTERGLMFAREVPIHASYRGKPLGIGYRADLIVAGLVLVEVKAVAGTIETHAAQTLSYLRFSGLRLGLLINFSAPLMKQGIRRVVNNL